MHLCRPTVSESPLRSGSTRKIRTRYKLTFRLRRPVTKVFSSVNLFWLSARDVSQGPLGEPDPARSPREPVRFMFEAPMGMRERGRFGDCAGELSRLGRFDATDERRDLGAMGESAGPRELGGHGSIDKRPRVGISLEESSGDEVMKLASWLCCHDWGREHDKPGEYVDESDPVRCMLEEDVGDAEPSDDWSSSETERRSTLLSRRRLHLAMFDANMS
jgi:hypothetical protein